MRLLAAIVLFAVLGDASPTITHAATSEQAVIVEFDYGNKDWTRFFEFEKTFEAAIADSGLGDYDGNELATDGSDGSMYIYGPDADKLFAFVKPRLLSASFLKNVRVTLRYGAANDPHAREVHTRLGS